jgi:hypothetical protein
VHHAVPHRTSGPTTSRDDELYSPASGPGSTVVNNHTYEDFVEGLPGSSTPSRMSARRRSAIWWYAGRSLRRSRARAKPHSYTRLDQFTIPIGIAVAETTPRHSGSVAAAIVRDEGRIMAIQRRDNA